jgi:hypothetical protein
MNYDKDKDKSEIAKYRYCEMAKGADKLDKRTCGQAVLIP